MVALKGERIERVLMADVLSPAPDPARSAAR
jgi:hypothetical protein